MIIAIDFDGTITKSHDDMVLRDYAREALQELNRMGCELILWTCRAGKTLKEAELFLQEEGLLSLFSKINEGSDHSFYPNTKKVLADFYIDDRNVFGFRGWRETLAEIKKLVVAGGKTREEIITGMCLTFRHDYGIRKQDDDLSCGVTEKEAKEIWREMSQIYDNEIAPLLAKGEPK